MSTRLAGRGLFAVLEEGKLLCEFDPAFEFVRKTNSKTALDFAGLQNRGAEGRRPEGSRQMLSMTYWANARKLMRACLRCFR